MKILSKRLPRLDEDDRLLPVLRGITSFDIISDSMGHSTSNCKLSANEVDKATVHFPLCMSSLHRKIRQDSHIKYGGRQQYGLFLKSIGLPLDEALVFWKRAFSAKYSDDQFQKNYSYNVRHNYGQEGKRANYSCYTCHRIISNAPGPGDNHGCPYRHSSIDSLAMQLSNYSFNGNNLNQMQINDVLTLVQNGHYQLACTKAFEFSRKIDVPMEPFISPVQFYEKSVERLKAMNGK